MNAHISQDMVGGINMYEIVTVKYTNQKRPFMLALFDQLLIHKMVMKCKSSQTQPLKLNSHFQLTHSDTKSYNNWK